jgi:hypothetical protein
MNAQGQQGRRPHGLGGVPTRHHRLRGHARQEDQAHRAATERAIRKNCSPLYVKNRILANAYPGETRETTNVDVWNLLVVPESADEPHLPDHKTMFEKRMNW